ncbi:MAG: ATP-binding cassette domain-containing protein [Actinobacteria bacterium]|nr:ATP-binding cassette domain-containing protein [Actinomycetota bacterium]
MLSIDALEKRYGDVVALAGASFAVAPGRILGFLGPNGAGKTTAMRCILGLVRPDAGEVRWQGRAVTDRDRLRFGYMPEERGLYPKMRVREQLVHFGRLSGLSSSAAGKAADSWLGVLGLAERASDKVDDLSHGNQQRVQLAVALVHDPVVLILDEPFSGLDPLAVVEVAGTLRDLADRGAAIVFSSHQLDLVEDILQDVAIIDHGRVVLSGELEELKTRSSRRRLDVVVDGRPWVPNTHSVEIVDDQGRFHSVVGKDAPVAEILAAATAAGEVDRFAFEPPTLSDLFREAVKR